MPDLIDQARALAARHFTRNAMAVELGLTCSQVDRLLRVNNITTTGKRGVKPMDDAPPIHGCGGQKPPKLMPSADALRRASVWGLAGHAPIAFRSPEFVFANVCESKNDLRKVS